MHTIIRTTISQYYVNQAVKRGVERQQVQPVLVTFVQRFGGAITLHVHFHCVFLEGIYLDRTEAGLKPRFGKGKPPSDADIAEVCSCGAGRRGADDQPTPHPYVTQPGIFGGG